jgi:hypothetical protein
MCAVLPVDIMISKDILIVSLCMAHLFIQAAFRSAEKDLHNAQNSYILRGFAYDCTLLKRLQKTARF